MPDKAMSFRRPLVFDLDGTLIDSRGDITAAINFGLRQLGRSELNTDTICGFVGNGAPYLLREVARAALEGPLSEEEHQTLSLSFHSYYREHPVALSTILPGAAEVLALGNRKFALCTNKPRSLTDLVISGLGWKSLFHAVVGGGDTPEKKPHSDPLVRVSHLLNVPAVELIMIGDGPQDIGAGKAVGAHTIGVRGGFLDESLLEASKPDVILESLLNLPAYLEQSRL